jgi:DNA invertase Pin-like site-specific DNA recombinase
VFSVIPVVSRISHGSDLDTARRSGFLELLNVCSDRRRREADEVLVYDVSRFSRLEPDEAAFHEFSLKRAGVRVIYTHEPGVNESGVAGILVKGLKRAMAHEYSVKLSQVVIRGQRAHAELGQWVGGRPPYGFRRALRQPDGTLTVVERWKARGETVVLMPDPLEAAVAVEMYESYVYRGMGLMAIAEMLNVRGVPTPRSDRRQGIGVWTKPTLWAMLRNPIYIGTLVYAKSRYSEVGRKRGKVRQPNPVTMEQAVPAIVPRELWEAAQAKHGTRKFGVGRPYHHPYLLSRLIVCDHCGKRFRAHKQARGSVSHYYMCASYHDSGPSVCDGLRIPASYLDEAVVKGIQKRLERVLNKDLLRSMLLEHLKRQPTDNLTELLEAKLAETRQQIKRLVDALADGADLQSVKARLGELERERARREAELQRSRAAVATESEDLASTVEELMGSLGRFRELLEAGTVEEQKAVVSAFLQEIRVKKATRQATLRWYRLPRTDVSLKLVELRGLEPLTPRLPALCSPN